MPSLKATESSLSCVQWFLYLVSSSINVFFILHGWIPSGQTVYVAALVRTQGTDEIST